MKIKFASEIKPSSRQIEWQQREFYGLIHFGMNTMNDVEWGEGNDNPNKFNPQNVDCNQWVKALKSAGMKGAILTCKHHDGFCLWPSKYTNYSVSSSPWKNGNGDLVKKFAEACKKYGLKLGIYLSPWDRTEATYGKGEEYDDFYINQLTELLTNYGEVFSVWLDGANGEEPNGKVQHYNWERYYQTIRELQPNAVISISGPDVRWVGNEAGQTRLNEWSVVPAYLKDPEVTAALSQQEDNTKFRKNVKTSDKDLGSRQILSDYNGELIWYPAEVDVSIRPGWFYHSNENNKVRSTKNLFDIYKKSVGRNTTLLLNIPPAPSGELYQNDIQVLEQLGNKIEQLYKTNLMNNSYMSFSSNPRSTTVDDLLVTNLMKNYWEPNTQDEFPWIELEWDNPQLVNTLILGEYIPEGQLIEETEIWAKNVSNEWILLNTVQSIGYRRIIEFEKVLITNLRINFKAFRKKPTINNIILTLMEEE